MDNPTPRAAGLIKLIESDSITLDEIMKMLRAIQPWEWPAEEYEHVRLALVARSDRDQG